MSGTLMIVAAVLAASPSRAPAEGTAVAAAAFRGWFDSARHGDLVIPGRVERAARGFRYVFVEGFWNERMPGYFAQNVRALRARGVPRSAIHVIEPSSHKTLEDNGDSVRDEFDQIARQGPEKLVVIAHSRGACDTLAFALRHPEFVRDHVEAMFLVQGPFGGTGVADYVAGDGSKFDGKLRPCDRLVIALLARLERLRLWWGGHAGLAEMTRAASRSFWENARCEHRGAIDVVGPRTYFVTSQARSPRLRPLQGAIARFLAAYVGPNDGIVAFADQSLPWLGTVLAVGESRHTDLTHRFPSGRPGRRLRTALVDAIIMAVGHTAEPKGGPTRRL